MNETKSLDQRKNKPSLFEVKRDGITLMHTDSENCIPSDTELKDMKKHGYTFFRDGKRFTP